VGQRRCRRPRRQTAEQQREETGQADAEQKYQDEVATDRRGAMRGMTSYKEVEQTRMAALLV
jgi:hypothetical protein